MDIFSKRDIGNSGEDIASLFLKKRGFFILDRNFRAGRQGELDIVAKKDDLLLFVEVKLRRTNTKGSPAESITFFKKKRLVFAAKCYLNIHKEYFEYNIRFDLIGIRFDKEKQIVEQIENIIDMSEF